MIDFLSVSFLIVVSVINIFYKSRTSHCIDQAWNKFVYFLGGFERATLIKIFPRVVVCDSQAYDIVCYWTKDVQIAINNCKLRQMPNYECGDSYGKILIIQQYLTLSITALCNYNNDNNNKIVSTVFRRGGTFTIRSTGELD